MTNFDIREDAIVALNGEQIDAVSGGFFGLLAFKVAIISSIFGGSKGNSCAPAPKPCAPAPKPCAPVNPCAPRC